MAGPLAFMWLLSRPGLMAGIACFVITLVLYVSKPDGKDKDEMKRWNEWFTISTFALVIGAAMALIL